MSLNLDYFLFKVALDSCGVWVFPYAGGFMLRCDEWRRALSGVWDLCFGCTGHRNLLSEGWVYNAGFTSRWEVIVTDSLQLFVQQLQGWVGMLVLYD